ncbi:Na+/H+-dicarboxylate symporter [Chitinophaga costaii]|uniref:Na+/H+-dicarboxylate symporter n=1 Tax=Chitinophaga costaii TaxID=1335309 RepID=A0A1C4EN39_9BACT|nr:dicarboxylate/amino acid:cation symporter [Chitinophaga costaii]PUZ22458.1 dicarboxylate/amino acid:cation symporter [Chitinophaga costaii]SCC45023.1 Na+/H+-dicarboxylate symporter [Chitinophaga costaii]
MATFFRSFLQSYRNIFWLLGGILAGTVAGLILGPRVAVLKPVGDIFINLLFMAVIPLVFFATTAAVANVQGTSQLLRLCRITLLVFTGTALVAAAYTLLGVYAFPLHTTLSRHESLPALPPMSDLGTQLTRLFTVDDFYKLLSRECMLPLIVFSLLVGFASLQAGEKGAAFRHFLLSGNEVMKHLLGYIMKVAPLGLGAYFAYQVGILGPQLFGTYARALGLYYGLCLVYYLVFYSGYVYFAGGRAALRRYWKYNLVPSLTAVATCSSVAAIPVNLEAGEKMGIPPSVRNLVLPLGATLHKEGSAISSMIKIAVVFALFHRPLSGVDTVAIALGMSVLVNMVEGGIPNGGYVGELLVMSVYGFPQEALAPLIIIGTLVDPMATLLNVSGETANAMLVARFMGHSLLEERQDDKA